MRHLHPQKRSSERTWDAGVISVIQRLRSPLVHKYPAVNTCFSTWKSAVQWHLISRFITEAGYGRCLLKISVAWNSILQVFNCQQTVKQPNHILCAMLAFVLQVYNCQKTFYLLKTERLSVHIYFGAAIFAWGHTYRQVTFVYIALYRIQKKFQRSFTV